MARELSPALAMWRRPETLPFGKAIFSRINFPKAPNFGSIRQRFEEFRPGRDVPVTVEVKDRAGEVVSRAVITMWVSPRRKT